jgi:hypothetical protein
MLTASPLALVADALSYADFLVRRMSFYETKPTLAPPPDLAEAFAQLSRDGVAVVPRFLNGAVVKAMCEGLPPLEHFEESPEADKSIAFSGADHVPSLRPFFHDPRLRRLVQAYIGDDATPARRKVEIRRTQGQVLAFDRLFHIDTWKHRLKLFLYLHDVGEDDAPLVYLKGSHKGSWRRRTEWLIYRKYKVGPSGYAADTDLSYIGCFWPYEINEIKARHGFSEFTCTAPAGSLIMFDARGVHRATPLLNSSRTLLIDYWVRRGHHT